MKRFIPISDPIQLSVEEKIDSKNRSYFWLHKTYDSSNRLRKSFVDNCVEEGYYIPFDDKFFEQATNIKNRASCIKFYFEPGCEIFDLIQKRRGTKDSTEEVIYIEKVLYSETDLQEIYLKIKNRLEKIVEELSRGLTK